MTSSEEQGLSARLCELVAAHEQLDEHFARHQACIVRREYDAALREYDGFCGRLRGHIDEENRRVLPVYQRLGRYEPNGRPELFRAEHHQLDLLMTKVGALLDQIGSAEGLSPAVIVHVIEEEKSLKGVLEHHHCREQRYLYPGVQRVLSAETNAACSAAGQGTAGLTGS